MKMKSRDRIALAHGLLMNLEKSGDITCWNFWERETIKELIEENAKTCTESDLQGVMGRLTKEHDGLAQDDWQAFSGRVTKHCNDMNIR